MSFTRHNHYTSITKRNGLPRMLKANFLKHLVEQLSDALPSHVSSLKNDFEKNCRAVLAKTFDKFDLVTREEFDTQSKVLARTRKKLEDLENTLKEIESALKDKRRK